ncbi:MAG: (2Fe-2S)-binding protein [Flavobacteriaceae bacterium]|nr:(2Fe-2S)-binding protein [Flavobacteriaceae bacterium]
MKEKIKFSLNGRPIELETDTSQTLLWVIRTELGLTGTKHGCSIGFCGTCTILVDGIAERSCSLTVKKIEGKNVTTIEGLAQDGKLHPVQESFIRHDAQQCGFCTPGMIMNAVGLLNTIPNPSHKQIINGMNDNLCRCGSYNSITKAIESAAQEMKGGNKL